MPTTFQSMNNQLVAKGCATQGTSARKALQIVSETGFVNYNNSLLVASGLALKSAIYNQMGKHHLAVLNSQLLLNCQLKTYGNTVNGESQCKSLLNLAKWLGGQGDYDQAAVLFQLAGETHQSAPLKRTIAKTELQVSLEQFVARRQWERAVNVCEKMDTYDETEKGVSLATMNVERGNYPTAAMIIQKLLQGNDELNPLTKTQLNILQMRVMLGTETVNYAVMNLAIKVWIFARRHNLSYEVARIEVMIARIQLLLDMPTLAKGFIERALMKILSDGTLADQGDALWQYLKCLLLLVPKGEPQKVVALLTTESSLVLDGVLEMYTKLECSAKLMEIYQFLAELCHRFGLRAERNRFAFKFKQLVMENVSVIQ